MGLKKKYLQVNFKKIKLYFYGTLRTVAESFLIIYILIENNHAKCNLLPGRA